MTQMSLPATQMSLPATQMSLPATQMSLPATQMSLFANRMSLPAVGIAVPDPVRATTMETPMTDLRLDLPPIALRPRDADRLERLANAAMTKYPETADFLAREVERADMLATPDMPPGLVAMGSRVEFRLDGCGETRDVTLVYPDEADSAQGRISVLTPVGAALIGLSVGQTIEWQGPDGTWRALTVLRVEQPGA